MGITSDSEYDYDNNGTPLCLRVWEQLNLVPCKVILENQLVHPEHMKHLPTSENVFHQCKNGQESASHNKIKKRIPKTTNAKSKKKKW